MPARQDVHLDRALSDFSLGVLQDESGYVAGSVFPFVEVDKLSDRYYILDRNPFARGDAKPRGANQESAGFDFSLSNDSYACQVYALHTDVDGKLLRNADDPRLIEESAVRLVTNNLRLTFEVAWAERFFKSGVWGTTIAGVNAAPAAGQFRRWSDYASSGVLLMTLFRERLLARLLASHAISEELVAKLLAWRHPGFSTHVGEPIAPEEEQRLEDTAAYLVRNPLSLKKLVYLDGKKAVLYRSRMNPFLGRNFEAMDPLEWLARLSDHIPDPGQHRTLFYAEYSSRVRGSGESHEPETEGPQEEKPRKRCLSTWARLLAKVYQVDPLVCTRCGKRMSIAGFVTDTVAIRRILEHLGLSM